MSQDWNSYDKAAQKGPLSLGIKIIFLVFLLSCVIGGLGYVAGWFGETAQVAQEEFGPRALLKKYEHFKDMSAQLDAKLATIDSYQKGLDDEKAQMVDRDGKAIPIVEWPRDQRESFNQRATEIRGLKASFNNLAAEYNADMAKFNYRFTNVGDLPAGQTKVLPREYKPYITN